MNKKRVSRGSGPKIREDEISRMVALHLEGKSFKAIGKEIGRHWQSVRKYTLKALKERPGQELRREALKEALIAHFQDLVKALAVIAEMLLFPDNDSWDSEEWQSPTPDRRNRLLLEALRESHAKESPLWESWDRWNQDRQLYQEVLGTFRERVTLEIKNLEEQRSGSGLITTEYLVHAMSKRGVSIARGAAIYDPSMLNVKPGVDRDDKKNEDELFLGSSTQLASGQEMDNVLSDVSKIMSDMEEWTQVKALQTIFNRLVEIRDQIEEEVEVFSLKRAFPERCRLCPV